MQRLLESCDSSTVVGRRDLAILTLLARLGLRACEVARLRLDDIDWRAGEVTIRGKGSTIERLPLPHEAGEALVSYLRDGRPRVEFREVFVSVLRAAASAVTDRGGRGRRLCVRSRWDGARWPAPAASHARERPVARRHAAGADRADPQARQRRDHGDIRQDRPGGAQSARAPMAACGRCVMSSLREVAEDYLRMRRALGYKLELAGWHLEKFVTYLEQTERDDGHDRERGRVGDVGRYGPVVLGAAAVDRAPVRPPPADDRPGLRGAARAALALPRAASDPVPLRAGGDHRADARRRRRSQPAAAGGQLPDADRPAGGHRAAPRRGDPPRPRRRRRPPRAAADPRQQVRQEQRGRAARHHDARAQRVRAAA